MAMSKRRNGVTSLDDFMVKRNLLKKKLAVLTIMDSHVEKMKDRRGANNTSAETRSYKGVNVHNGLPSIIDFIEGR
jgi:hypothetical protein